VPTCRGKTGRQEILHGDGAGGAWPSIGHNDSIGQGRARNDHRDAIALADLQVRGGSHGGHLLGAVVGQVRIEGATAHAHGVGDHAGGCLANGRGPGGGVEPEPEAECQQASDQHLDGAGAAFIQFWHNDALFHDPNLFSNLSTYYPTHLLPPTNQPTNQLTNQLTN